MAPPDYPPASTFHEPHESRFCGWLASSPGPQHARQIRDSGEGRWTIKAAIDEGVPAHVLSAALYERFSSRGEAAFADKLLSAMRYGNPAGAAGQRRILGESARRQVEQP
jgi:hypothetical protein